MILVRMHGGMGNQLFQYAAGRALAARLGVEVALDPRMLAVKGTRPCWGNFRWRVVPPADLKPADLPPVRQDGLARYALWRAFGRHPVLRRERGLGYNPGFESWGDDSYLHGYWQSERYFAGIADLLRDEFTVVPEPSAQAREMAARIGAGPSISLHVRRGDYLTLAAHAICSEAYYRAALERVVAQTGIAPRVFVFSDDPDWAKANLDLPCEKVVVDFNGPETDYEDLRLMGLCQHNIIANSSFSWWGAWLNRSPGKVVVGPGRWFGNPKLHNPDIFPEGWIRVEA